MFFNGDVRAQRCAASTLQRLRSTHDQVIGRECNREIFALNHAIVAHIKVQGVAPVDQHEDRLQQVVAVGAAAGAVVGRFAGNKLTSAVQEQIGAALKALDKNGTLAAIMAKWGLPTQFATQAKIGEIIK